MATKFITVSIEIMHDKNLTPNQKFILAEIEQLSQLEKGCYASNSHFSELIGINKSGVSKAITKLELEGYIKTEIKKGSRNTIRIITLLGSSHRNNSSSHSVETKENKTKNITIAENDEALEIYKEYKKNIKASKSKQSALNNISKWLKEYKAEDLIKAISNYKFVADKQSDKKYIKECSNFFGVKNESNGFFKDYIERNEIAENSPTLTLNPNSTHKSKPKGVAPKGYKLKAIIDSMGNVECWKVVKKEGGLL